MADESNPYAAPESRAAENFIAVQSRRRPVDRFAVSVFCWAIAALLLALIVSACASMIYYPPVDFDWTMPRFVFILVPITISMLAWFLAGRAFWWGKDRLGSILFLSAIGAFVLIFLGPILLP